MEFEFVLPQRNEDLLNTTGNRYCVTQTYNEKDCKEKLRLAKLAFAQDGTVFIFDHFDVFYSIIENANKIQFDTIRNAMDVLFKAIDMLCDQELTRFLQNPASSNNIRNIKLNALRMLIYAEISLVKKVDKDVIGNEGKKYKKNSDESYLNSKWEDLRYSALLQLFNVLQLPLGNLWDPPVPEESFVNLCADFAYRTIEHPTIHQDIVEDVTFQVLGTLLKRYSHSIVFPTRIFELMKGSESAAKAIASGIDILYNKYGLHNILKVIIEQILNGIDGNVGDGPVVKNISAFFTELGLESPVLIMPFIREIAGDILNLESYQLRICFLQLMAEIVTKQLTGEDKSHDEKEMRDEYLDYILAHILDVNAHVRSKALALWCQMKHVDAVPLIWLSRVTKQAVGRLEDKSNLVRKSSIILIRSFLERNPYAAKLSIGELEARYKEKSKQLHELRNKMAEEANKADEVNEKWDLILAEMQPFINKCLEQESIEDEGIRAEDCESLFQQFPKMIEEKAYERLILLTRKAEELNGNWDTVKDMEPLHAQLYYAMLLKSYYLLQHNCKSFEEEYKNTENAVRFLDDSLEFSRIIVEAVPKLQELLMSKVDSDVVEAINFFTTAYKFQIKNTESGMRQLLYLVWSLSKDKRGPVRDAYRIVLFSTDKQGRAHSIKAVFNLLRFIENLTYSQFVAFEELVKDFVESEDIDNNMIQAMFEIYTKKLDKVTDNDSRLALKLLVVCSNIKPSIARANAALLEDLCFAMGEGLKDSRVFTLTLEFLMNVNADKNDEVYRRLEADDSKTSSVIQMFRKYFFNDATKLFDEVCSKTFQFIYDMCHIPNTICQDLIIEIWDELMEISESLRNEGEELQVGEAVSEIISQAPALSTQLTQRTSQPELNIVLNLPVTLAARFVYMIGYIAMKELIYLDVDIFSNLKYRQDLTDNMKGKRKNPAQPRPSAINMSSAMAVKRRSAMPMPQPEDDEHEDDVVGQSSDDVFAEQINAILENEMLFHKDSIFKRFIPMIIDFLKHPAQFNHPELQRAAVLSLIHFMSVSSEFCEKNMQFLMNIFQHTRDIDIKCNVIIGMSDLTFRFPNVIEPWSGHLYSTLHDENRDLRLTSVRILSHLISHEMILVKGQISDLAMCLVDLDTEIRRTTEVFFKEIANKSNILYNVLPDIISRLSDPKLKLEEGKYQTIMKYIMGLISKDRQIEGLVEKLCYRFKVTEQERQWTDIAYCLSLVTYTEKTIKKLIDNIGLFKDKVQVNEVYEYFKQIIQNTLKLAKDDLKTVVKDFETKLEDCLNVTGGLKADGERDMEVRSSQIKPPVVKRPGRGAKKTSVRARGRKVASSGSSSDSETENQPPSRSKGRKARVIQSDSEDEHVSQKRTPARRTRSTKVIQEPTSSDETPSHSTKPTTKRSKRR